jgi:hypothetical protein
MRPAAWITVSIMIAILVLAAPGCGDSNDKASTAEKATTAETGQTTEKGETAAEGEAGQEATGSVPSTLDAVESGAEDTIDFARQGSRAKVVRTARELQRDLGPASTDLRKAGVESDRIAALEARVRVLQSLAPHGDFDRISLAANQISALMPEFFGRYHVPVPPDVLELDYLDREAQLRSVVGDADTVSSAVQQLASTWAGLRRRVIDAGGRRLAARFSRHVALMRHKAGDPKSRALQKEAAVGLELVDELEHQFRK